MNFAGNLEAINLVSGAITAWFIRIPGKWRKFWSRKQNTFNTSASPVLTRNEIHIRVWYVSIKQENIYSEGTKELNSGIDCVGGKT
jgi:hypothetical protein